MLEDQLSDDFVDDPGDIERVVLDGEKNGNKSESERGSAKEEENNETNDKEKEKIKIKKRIGPRPTLNAQRLKGPRGIGIMESFFSDIKLHEKRREKEDLDLVMGRLEHWTHRLMPSMQFDDCLKKIEKLGSKKEVANYVNRIRLGLEEEFQDEIIRDELPDSPPPPMDPFDQLMSSSSVPATPNNMEMTTDQRERMLRNRLIAEERRAARIKRAQEMKEKFQANLSHSQIDDNVENPENQRKDNTDQGNLQEKSQRDIQFETDECLTNIQLENEDNIDGIEVGSEKNSIDDQSKTFENSVENKTVCDVLVKEEENKSFCEEESEVHFSGPINIHEGPVDLVVEDNENKSGINTQSQELENRGENEMEMENIAHV